MLREQLERLIKEADEQEGDDHPFRKDCKIWLEKLGTEWEIMKDDFRGGARNRS